MVMLDRLGRQWICKAFSKHRHLLSPNTITLDACLAGPGISIHSCIVVCILEAFQLSQSISQAASLPLSCLSLKPRLRNVDSRLLSQELVFCERRLGLQGTLAIESDHLYRCPQEDVFLSLRYPEEEILWLITLITCRKGDAKGFAL
jgi:hypothetical protein